MLRRLYSWIRGRSIGEIGFTKSNPFMISEVGLMGDYSFYCLDEYVWTGFRWEFVRHLQLTLDEVEARCAETN